MSSFGTYIYMLAISNKKAISHAQTVSYIYISAWSKNFSPSIRSMTKVNPRCQEGHIPFLKLIQFFLTEHVTNQVINS
jgi:hypothetical protein